MAAIASRYARAFTEAVFDLKLDPAAVLAELRSILELINGNTQLQQVWATPAITSAQKIRVLDALLQKLGGSKEVRNFLAILIERGRIAQLAEITREFEHELNNHMGIAEAEVLSARPLGSSERAEMEEQIRRLAGKSRVQATYLTDADLLGGVIVKMGSTIYDGSVRGQLQKIREQLVTA